MPVNSLKLWLSLVVRPNTLQLHTLAKRSNLLGTYALIWASHLMVHSLLVSIIRQLSMWLTTWECLVVPNTLTWQFTIFVTVYSFFQLFLDMFLPNFNELIFLQNNWTKPTTPSNVNISLYDRSMIDCIPCGVHGHIASTYNDPCSVTLLDDHTIYKGVSNYSSCE